MASSRTALQRNVRLRMKADMPRYIFDLSCPDLGLFDEVQRECADDLHAQQYALSLLDDVAERRQQEGRRPDTTIVLMRGAIHEIVVMLVARPGEPVWIQRMRG